MSAPVEVFVSFPPIGDWHVSSNIGEVRYLRADLVVSLIEALTTINNALREHDRERRLGELLLVSYCALARVREEML